MKIVVLVDSNITGFGDMVNFVDYKDISIANTEECDEGNEYFHILESIEEFDRSSNEILLVKFSGKETVISELGDECSEMIVAISSNKRSPHYSANPVDTFTTLIRSFEKETRPTK